MSNPNWKWRVINGDSRDFLSRIPDNSIDLILTDPPYNIGKYSTGNIPLPGRSAINNDLAEWDLTEINPSEWADEFVRILRADGNLFIFTSYNQIGLWHAALDKQFTSTNFMVWHKTNPVPQIFKTGFLNSCELVLTCWNKKHVWNFKGQAQMHNFFESPICMRPERLSSPKHPAQKPVQLLSHIIEIASNECGIVFDPFMGVGSAGVAALNLNRRYIGIELDKTYFNAAKQRLMAVTSADNSNEVAEATVTYGQNRLFDDVSMFDALFNYAANMANTPLPQSEAIIKWPGGKERELTHIHSSLPENIDRYFEPFVGGGSVFGSISANRFFINDLSSELTNLYRHIKEQSEEFFNTVMLIDAVWEKSAEFCAQHPQFKQTYRHYATGQITEPQLKEQLRQIAYTSRVADIIKAPLPVVPNLLCDEIYRNALRKFKRMRTLELEKGILPDKDLDDNIETIVKGSVYMYFRNVYNDPAIYNTTSPQSAAIFMFIRNYCYSGMFRYNDSGEFNVPYGGIAYNSKHLTKKLEQYRHPSTEARMHRCEIFNLDFEIFLRSQTLSNDDFIFLDPLSRSALRYRIQHLRQKPIHPPGSNAPR